MTTSAARTWPPAGSWIRCHFPRNGWATARWHRFTGDAIWSLPWPGPSFETACGYQTGSMWALQYLKVVETEPDAPCKRCLRAGRARGDQPTR